MNELRKALEELVELDNGDVSYWWMGPEKAAMDKARQALEALPPTTRY